MAGGLVYSRIWQSLTPELKKFLPDIGLPVPEIWESASPELAVAGRILVTSLSFTHLNELMAIDDPSVPTWSETASPAK